MDYDLCIDTALSWDGVFPDPDPDEDYEVELSTLNEGTVTILVSSRYVGARSEEDAAEIAISAAAERYGYEVDDEGELVDVDLSDVGCGRGKPIHLVGVRRPAPEDDSDGDEDED